MPIRHHHFDPRIADVSCVIDGVENVPSVLVPFKCEPGVMICMGIWGSTGSGVVGDDDDPTNMYVRVCVYVSACL